MNWSFRAGSVLGADVRIHHSNALFLAVAWWSDPVLAVGLAALLAFVLLHEMGHALAARRLGVDVIDIILFPLGGVARMRSIPRVPRIEFLVAVAGPATNAAIALVLAPLVLYAGRAWPEIHEPLRLAVIVNLLMVAFNLLPAFPLDGSKVLRAILGWLGMSFFRATAFVVALTRFLAAAMAVAAFVLLARGQPQGIAFLLGAGFSWLCAEQERRNCALRMTSSPSEEARRFAEFERRLFGDDNPGGRAL